MELYYNTDTVAVRDVISDYSFDDSTPCIAVVTEYQGCPFTLPAGKRNFMKVQHIF